MNEAERLVAEKIEELFRWESVKRREKTALSALVGAALATLIALVLGDLTGAALPLAAIFLAAFAAAAVASWWTLPRRETARLRAVALADRKLAAGETVLTAWEILSRSGKGAPELIVLREAAARLSSFAPRSALPRPFLWQSVAAPLLGVALAVSLVLHEAGFSLVPTGMSGSLAGILQSRAREYHERAEAQRLPGSLELARSLEELAADALRGKIDESEFRERLAELAGKPQAGVGEGAAHRVPLEAASALKAELEAWRHLAAGDLGLRRSGEPFQGLKSGSSERALEESLSRFPALRQELGRRLSAEQLREGSPSSAELQSALEAVEAELVTELDRATQREIRQFVASLLSHPGGQEKRPEAEAAGALARAPSDKLQPNDSRAQLPGSEAGRKRGDEGQAATRSGGVATQLSGVVRQGSGASAVVRAESPKGESRLAPREVLARYQRQAEEALASEEIPEALRETVRNYFLSLGGEQEGR